MDVFKDKSNIDPIQRLNDREREYLKQKGVLAYLDPRLERNLIGHPAFNCPTCGKKFFGVHGILRHQLTHTDDKPFKCSRCSFSTTARIVLKKHLAAHEAADKIPPVVTTPSVLTIEEDTLLKTNGYINNLGSRICRNDKGELAFKCSDCEKQFFGLKSFQNHLYCVHKEKQFKCHLCEFATISNRNLTRHILTHSEDRQFVCKICNASFKKQALLRNHESAHENNKIHKCVDCEKEFVGEHLLKQHIISKHPGSKPIECQFCGKRFICNFMRNAHESTHTGTEKYECNLCDRKFPQKPAYLAHMRCHANKEEHECYFCKKVFPDKISFKYHQSKHTEFFVGDSKKLQCPKCDKKTNRWWELETHSRIVHDNESVFVCDICQMNFRSKDSLRTHKQIHERKEGQECYVCKQKFTDRKLFERHKEESSDCKKEILRKFKCITCDSQFSSFKDFADHVEASHKDRKPFKCALCASDFLSARSLRAHHELHETKKEFECYFCNEILTDYVLYKKHRFGHTDLYNKDDNIFKCLQCSYKNPKWNELVRHHKSIHKNEKPFDCKTCNLHFKNVNSMIQHKLTKKHLSMVERANGTQELMEFEDRNSSKAENKKMNIPTREKTYMPIAAAVVQESAKNNESLKIIWTKKNESDLLTLAASLPNCVIFLLNQDVEVTNKIQSVKQKCPVQKVEVQFLNGEEKFTVQITLVSSDLQKIGPVVAPFKSIRSLQDYLSGIQNTRECTHFMRENIAEYFEQFSNEYKSRLVICNVITTK